MPTSNVTLKLLLFHLAEIEYHPVNPENMIKGMVLKRITIYHLPKLRAGTMGRIGKKTSLEGIQHIMKPFRKSCLLKIRASVGGNKVGY